MSEQGHSGSNPKRMMRLGYVGYVGMVVVVTMVVAACSSSTSPTSQDSHNPNSQNPLAGERFNFVMASSPDLSKVVEVHAVNLLKAQGVKTSIKYDSASPQVAIAQMQRGDIDAFSESVTGDLNAIAAGVKETDFALAQPRQDYVLITNKRITSLAGLKGGTIGISSVSGVNPAQALLVLQQAGLTAKDVQFVVDGGQTTRAASLLAGRVDATMLSHAFAAKAEAQGFHVLFDFTKQAADLYDDNVFAMTSWLAKHKPLAVAFNKALLDSFVWFDNPANEDAVIAEALKIQPDADKTDVKQLVETLRTGDAYPAGAILDSTELTRLQQLYVDSGALTKSIPVDQWVDTSFAEQAKSEK
jgi:ABC-type nitrate/sulfonate/bicarbonate transport system substrate-binding protein